MFASYSIRAKITAVVALLLVAMTGMGLLAVRNMRAINADAVDIQANWLPCFRVLGELRMAVATYRTILRNHMLSETVETKADIEQRLAATNESVAEIRRKYEKFITSAEERAVYAGIQRHAGQEDP